MHPPVPAGQISLDLNYDMLLPIGIPRSVSLGGAERIDFWPTVQTVAKAFDLALLPDPTPGAGHYYRSDHFSLARVGIPAFSVDQGELVRGPHEEWGRAQFEDYVAHHYHQPRTSTMPTGISAAMPSWRGLGLCWAGWRAGRRSRWSGCRG
jgi:Zn-dependent M28 family amino/carboxypeptidase